MRGNPEIEALNRKAAEAAQRRENEKYITALCQRKTLDPHQPFVVIFFSLSDDHLWGQNRNFSALRQLGSFKETLLFLVCFLDEVKDRIKRKEVEAAVFSEPLGVEHIVHGIVSQVEAGQFLQLARDFGFLDASGNVRETDSEPGEQLDLAFLSVAAASKSVIRRGPAATGALASFKKDWEESVDKRLKALKKK